MAGKGNPCGLEAEKTIEKENPDLASGILSKEGYYEMKQLLLN